MARISLKSHFPVRITQVAAVSIATLALSEPVLAQTAAGTTVSMSRENMKKAGSLLNGVHDVQLQLFDAPTGGTQCGPTVTKANVTITGGTLPDQLVNFGKWAFDGDARWLATSARQGSAAYVSTGPRERVRLVPYALALPGLYTLQNPICPSLVGGYAGNHVDAIGGTIAGGGQFGGINTVSGNFGAIGGGTGNLVTGDAAVIAGGFENTSESNQSAVGGGYSNSATGGATVVAGGYNNSASGNAAAIGGGESNNSAGTMAVVAGGKSNTASGNYSAVGGGYTVSATGGSTVVAGGYNNIASGNGAAIGGGESNNATGTMAVVAGGRANTASGNYSAVCGGDGNSASASYSFAGGRRTFANYVGTFVWGDSVNANKFSYGDNSFTVHASGGSYFYSNVGSSTGVYLPPGGGSWSAVSDRNLKRNLQDVDCLEVLERLDGIPMTTWSYLSQDSSIRHMGPMAQDFHAAFGIGEDDRHITQTDADGVLFAAVQGLRKLQRDAAAKLDSIQVTIDQLSASVRQRDELIAAQQDAIELLQKQLAGGVISDQ